MTHESGVLAADLAPGTPASSEGEPPSGHDVWVIEPRVGGVRGRAREVWRYRRLLGFFARKSLQKLYARTKLGWVWIFIRPLFPLLVKTLVFGGLLGVGSEGVPYFLFLVGGMVTWELFSSALMWGTRSLELNRGLLRQIYLPRVILPLSMMMPAFMTFIIYMAVFLSALAYFYLTTGKSFLLVRTELLWAPVVVLMTVAFAVGLAFWTSVPALVARDVRFTLAYVLGFWIFLTPILYPLSAVPEHLRTWVLLNPMAAIVETFKWSTLGIGQFSPTHLAVSAALIVVTFFAGLAFFLRAEANAADKV